MILTFFHKIKPFYCAFQSTKAVFEPLLLLYGVVTHAYQPKNSEIFQNKKELFCYKLEQNLVLGVLSLKKLILLSSEELIQQRYEKYRQIENYK
ncbi:hypothetical protein F8160_22925 [Bacillus sp. CH126_4D]|nr:hypothetical protein F8160_22925 [Bacillus sp. CH126_4D]